MVLLDECICSVNNRYFMVHIVGELGCQWTLPRRFPCNPAFVFSIYKYIYIWHVLDICFLCCMTVVFLLFVFFHLFDPCTFVEILLSIYQFLTLRYCFHVKSGYISINLRPSSNEEKKWNKLNQLCRKSLKEGSGNFFSAACQQLQLLAICIWWVAAFWKKQNGKRKIRLPCQIKQKKKQNTYLAINVVVRGSHVRSSTRTITRSCSWTIVLWLLPLYSLTTVTENTSWLSSRCWFNFYFPWQYLKRFPRPNEVSSISLRPVVNVWYPSCKVWLALLSYPHGLYESLFF